MPLIRIYGVPDTVDSKQLEKVAWNLQSRLEDNPDEFWVGPGSTSTFFPKDHLKAGLGEELIAVVTTRKKPERTDEVLAALAKAVAETISAELPAPRVECFISLTHANHFHLVKNQ